MSSAPDHDPSPSRPPTNWARIIAGLVGLALGLAMIGAGIASLTR